MATKPNPRLLPKVTYQPPQDPPPQPHSLYGDAVNASEQFGPVLNQMANSLYGGLNQAGSYLFGGEPGKVAYPENYQPKVARPVTYDPVGQTPPGWQPTTPDMKPPGTASPDVMGPPTPNGPVGRTPPGWTPGAAPTPAPTGGEMAGPGNDQTVAAWQATLDKNQNLTQQAKDTGNDKELARLQAEWDRIAPMAQKYGITAERLVNSYMQPGNAAAESSLERAMGKAIADDTWANAATIAFGRPPNQLEWDEHWRAMNKGGRDPLEGHPQAIQAIQQRMQEIQQDNQKQAFGQYQQWLNSQT